MPACQTGDSRSSLGCEGPEPPYDSKTWLPENVLEDPAFLAPGRSIRRTNRVVDYSSKYLSAKRGEADTTSESRSGRWKSHRQTTSRGRASLPLPRLTTTG